jgi:Zn-finger nucleic acid-binding protein
MATPAQLLRCPGCGAPAAAGAAHCDYCRAPLTTVTCPSCFGAMFVGSRFCAHCGAVATRDTVEEAATLDCPRCRSAMQALRLGTTSVHECAACGGLWMDPESLQHLAERNEERGMVMGALLARVDAGTVQPDVVRYIPCPLCTKLMNRVNFAHSSGVVLDVCKSHGVWLDRGELQRVLGFIEKGGLSMARKRELEHLAEEQRRLTALRGEASPSTAGGSWGISAHFVSSSGGEAGASGGALGQLLLDALGVVHR